MKIKTLVLAALLSIGFPLAAQAETASSSNKLSCDSECSQLNIAQSDGRTRESDTPSRQPEIFQDRSEPSPYEDEPSPRQPEIFQDPSEPSPYEDDQPNRTRIRRTSRSSDLKKLYLGGTLGLFSPGTFDDFPEIVDNGDSEPVDFGTGFGASLYGGYKFSNFIGADLELLLFGGSAEPLDDSVYAAAGVFLNPRFTYAFNQDNVNKSPYAFVSPGLGIVSVGFGEDLETRLDVNDIDTSGSGVALQLKAGVGYAFSETIDIFGQVRYFTAFNVYSEDDIPDSFEADDQNFSSLGLELGLNFKI